MEKISLLTHLVSLAILGASDGESTHLPPMWPGFNTGLMPYEGCHEFAGSSLAPRVFL